MWRSVVECSSVIVNDPLRTWITPGAAAQLLGVTTERVRQLTREGRLTHIRTALGRLIEPESVHRLHAHRAGKMVK